MPTHNSQIYVDKKNQLALILKSMLLYYFYDVVFKNVPINNKDTVNKHVNI